MNDNKNHDTESSIVSAVERLATAIDTKLSEPIEKRNFLKAGAATSAAVIATASGLTTSLKTPRHRAFLSTLFQKHYKKLSEDDKKKVLARLERETKEDYKVDVKIGDPPPLPGVQFGYFLNLLKCNGNRACVDACRKKTIKTSRSPTSRFWRWIVAISILRNQISFIQELFQNQESSISQFSVSNAKMLLA